jgi:hypothetical protein
LKDDNNNKKKTLYSTSKITLSGPIGIINQFNKERQNIKMLERMKIILLLLFGMIFSLKINLPPSMKDCKLPFGPTMVGPSLLCIAAKVFLSTYIINAIAKSIGTN